MKKERQARLQHMMANQHKRLANETEEERDIRLQLMRTTQHERLAAETAGERNARMQRDSEMYREYQAVHPWVPLLHQHAVQAKS